MNYWTMKGNGVSMNGYKMIADDYRKMIKDGVVAKEEVEKEIRIYEFLATCDIDDFCIMVDSSAFNDIIRAFLKLVLNNVNIDEKVRECALNELRWVFDEKTAREVLNSH